MLHRANKKKENEFSTAINKHVWCCKLPTKCKQIRAGEGWDCNWNTDISSWQWTFTECPNRYCRYNKRGRRGFVDQHQFERLPDRPFKSYTIMSEAGEVVTTAFTLGSGWLRARYYTVQVLKAFIVCKLNPFNKYPFNVRKCNLGCVRTRLIF